jgi:protein-tyrosine phosphatase
MDMESNGAAEGTGARRLALDGAINFRDLGGYRTADGRMVAWRRLYRSDSLAELSDADLVALDSLKLLTICDLRVDHERERRPNRLPEGHAARVHALGFVPPAMVEVLKGAAAGTLLPEQGLALLRELYQTLPLDHTEAYRRIVRILLEPDALPAVIHCTSGKDRTGFVSALILMAVGVPRVTILEDYALSDLYRRDLRFMLPNIDPALAAAITQAHPDFLRASFEAIDRQWGGDERYLEQAIGLDAPTRERLRNLLLEGSA